MRKTYKGYELIKEIAEGNIKNGTKIRDNYGEYIIERIEDLNITEIFRIDEEEKTIPDYSYFADKDNEFEIIENEIDIQDIKELDTSRTYQNYELTLKINELIQVTKQLDNKINK